MFANNEEHKCSLDTIELSQTQMSTPMLHCNQYVRNTSVERRYKDMDIERSRMAGMYDTYKDKIKRKK
jgi:hypothetical protein